MVEDVENKIPDMLPGGINEEEVPEHTPGAVTGVNWTFSWTF